MNPQFLAGLKIPRRKACRFDSGPGHHRLLAMVFECVPAFVPAHVPVSQEFRPCRIARRGFFFLVSGYFGHASRSPSTFAWQSAYILTVSVAQASTSRPVTPVSRSRPGQLESKFAGIGIAGDLGVEDAQPICVETSRQVHRALHDLFQSDRDGAVFGFIG